MVRPRKLKRGDKIFLKFGASRYGIVTADQRDDIIWYALEIDDPSDPYYGRRTARRLECSAIHSPAPLGTPLAELFKGPR
jgi:hypothetical protein